MDEVSGGGCTEHGCFVELVGADIVPGQGFDVKAKVHLIVEHFSQLNVQRCSLFASGQTPSFLLKVSLILLVD